MTGTGFLDSWKPVDTNKEPSQQMKVEATPAPSLVEQQSGFGADDFPIEALVDKEPPVEVVEVEPELTPQNEWSFPQSANPAWKRIAVATSEHIRDVPKVLCGVIGDRKGGKSGMLLDSLTEEEKKNGAQIWSLDFDGGGDSTRSAHHKDSQSNIVILPPYVTEKRSSRVPFNYPKTFNQVMDDLNYAIEVAEKQDEYFKLHGRMPNPYLKTLIFDGMDHWLQICGITMKIEDLELGDDAIDVSGRKTATKIGRFNWEFRKNRYDAAVNSFKELSRLNVHVYVISGLKPSYDSNGNEITGAEVPAWLKDTERDLEQLIEISVEHERNENGDLTGKTVSTAQLKFNRTSLRLPKPVVVFVQEVGNDGVWYGYKGIRDGSFESEEDTNPAEEDSE